MISRLDIQGYKSIKNQSVELRNINVLIGGNGIGKSNFISAFELMRNIYKQNLQNYVITKNGANSLLYLGSKNTSEINIELSFDNNDASNKYIVNLEESQNSLYIKSSQIAYLEGEGWKFKDYDANKFEATLIDKRDREAKNVASLMESFEIYHFHDTGDTSPLKRPSNVNDNKYLRPDGSNIASFLYYLQQVHHKNFVRIERTVASVSPFFRGFNLSPNRLNNEIISLEWLQEGAGDNYFNAYQLSDGTLRFICLTTLLMQPNPPKTIIIDEPELGLHPSAINKLAALIEKASVNSQIILSTQSVNLVDNFEPKDIIVVDRINNASSFRHLNEEELTDWLEDYSLGQVWEKNIIGGQPF